MGDSNKGDVSVPIGMIYIFGLRICWDRKVFLDGAVRAGDKIVFHKPAKIGDTITTRLSIADKKEVKKEKDGQVRISKFLSVDMNATNQAGDKIVDIQMSFLLPKTMQ
jgi:acyl dehydratase